MLYRTASNENDGFDHVIDDAQSDAIKILGLLFRMEEMNLALTNWQTILRILATPFEYIFGVYQHHAFSDASSDGYFYMLHICRDVSDSRAVRTQSERRLFCFRISLTIMPMYRPKLEHLRHLRPPFYVRNDSRQQDVVQQIWPAIRTCFTACPLVVFVAGVRYR